MTPFIYLEDFEEQAEGYNYWANCPPEDFFGPTAATQDLLEAGQLGVIAGLASTEHTICREQGHDFMDESWAGPDSGGMAGTCTRCGYSFCTTLY